MVTIKVQGTRSTFMFVEESLRKRPLLTLRESKCCIRLRWIEVSDRLVAYLRLLPVVLTG